MEKKYQTIQVQVPTRSGDGGSDKTGVMPTKGGSDSASPFRSNWPLSKTNVAGGLSEARMAINELSANKLSNKVSGETLQG